ncbi:hypothetical protein EMIHUDRAFT_244230 [Emiliania huxleyi CCMP1516]|uniref:COMM domain-containing protein n=2 Tax=Emiliania huxleyi TaxID=2903 RepID=A0A0D3J173_EMIH1|nr:hypothetical protein EMIHUDRAFT_244230 [Emiliania huxleyi CCMP1516]EOD17258.1 hypothetical protein EMIHUDRAFT_244230 [Emiliania huxleyi CCMP1516]|eukprot:XP_005769687.1 hypothetical protein EMIHUDRAFT_244230 [Emiliania huxleyi CCMP1516]
MPSRRRQPPVASVWDIDVARAAFEASGLKPIHIRPLLGWLLRHPEVQSWEDVGARWESEALLRNVPLAARKLLCARFAVSSSRVEAREDSSYGATTKLAVELSDGLRVYTISMRHGGQNSACVSWQISYSTPHG